MHNQYDDFYYANKKNAKLAYDLKYENDRCIDAMMAGKAIVDEKIQVIRAEQTEYVNSNAMDFEMLKNDDYAKQLREQLAELEKQSGDYKANIAQLDSDNRLIDEQMGWIPQVEEEKTNSIERNISSDYDVHENLTNGKYISNKTQEDRQEVEYKDDGLVEEPEVKEVKTQEKIEKDDGLGEEPEIKEVKAQERIEKDDGLGEEPEIKEVKGQERIEKDDGLGEESEIKEVKARERIENDGLGEEPEIKEVKAQERIEKDDGLGDEPEIKEENAKSEIEKNDGLGNEQASSKENEKITTRTNDTKMDNDNSM